MEKYLPLDSFHGLLRVSDEYWTAKEFQQKVNKPIYKFWFLSGNIQELFSSHEHKADKQKYGDYDHGKHGQIQNDLAVMLGGQYVPNVVDYIQEQEQSRH